MDPYIDPYGALFLLDYTSNKAGKAGAEWFEKMYSLGSTTIRNKEEKDNQESVDTSRWRWDCLPGWMYARALAARIIEGGEVAAVRSFHWWGRTQMLIKAQEDSKSRAYLQEAFETYPEVIPLLAAKADISLSAKWSASKALRIVTDYS